MSLATRLTAGILLLSAFSSPAPALTTSHLATDAAMLALVQSFDFVGEGRIGDRGGAATFELDLGPDTGAPFVSAQYNWVSAQVEPFSLVWDAGLQQATFMLGGRTLVFPTILGANEVFVRTRAVNGGTSVMVTNLVLDGTSVGDVSSATGDGLDILRIEGATLTDGLTLTGDAVLTFGNPAPTQSRLAFQLKVGHVLVTPTQVTTWGRVKTLYR